MHGFRSPPIVPIDTLEVLGRFLTFEGSTELKKVKNPFLYLSSCFSFSEPFAVQAHGSGRVYGVQEPLLDGIPLVDVADHHGRSTRLTKAELSINDLSKLFLNLSTFRQSQSTFVNEPSGYNTCCSDHGSNEKKPSI